MSKMAERLRKHWRGLLVLAFGIGGVVLLFFVQDFSESIVAIDRYTPIFLVLCIVGCGLCISAICGKRTAHSTTQDKTEGKREQK